MTTRHSVSSTGAARTRAAFAVLGALLLAPAGASAQSQRFDSKGGPLALETVASGLQSPWGMAFMPDGGILVTERPGTMRIVRDGKVSEPLQGLPAVASGGQGGLLDVAIGPGFATDRLIFWTFSEPREGGNGTAVARGRLSEDGTRVENAAVIFRQMPTFQSSAHFGSRLAFAPDGNLFVTLGERFSGREKAQDLTTHFGKVVRIAADGSVPKDNPFAGRQDARPEIWSYGHRNPQAAAINPWTQALWTVEHGAKGGDEINIPQAGKNYGWPVISYGVNYDGSKIGEGTRKEGMEQPIYFWDPSIAPSGMAFVTSDAIPGWKGSLLVGALKGQMLVRLSLDGDRITGEERLLRDLRERIRDVRQGPDGAIWLLTDSSNGRLLRLTRAD
jgi:glucose/arabinose dehydrogenase